MFNARDLLGQIMQTAMTDTTAHRMRHALGPSALGRADGPLAQVLGQSGQGAGVGGALGGLAGMADSMLGDAGRSVHSGSPLAVGAWAPSPARCSAVTAARSEGRWAAASSRCSAAPR